MTNEFSPTWFETFLAQDTAAPIDREVEFIRAHLPIETFPRLLDVPCGIGRHANPLARLGYDVIGIDRSTAAIAEAQRKNGHGATFQVLDMKDLPSLRRTVDGVLCLWSSFGYGTPDENERLLGDMTDRLRAGGRLLLDVYNPDALHQLPASETTTRGERVVTTRREFTGRRFRVHLNYSGTSDEDHFDWLTYTPEQLIETAAAVGLSPLLACAWFDADIAPSANHLRMQLLFEKGGLAGA